MTDEQKLLYHAAKLRFESNGKTKALMYQDRQSTARELKHIKTIAIRCSNIAPDFSADLLRNILEHYSVLVNGRLKGRAYYTPQSLITPWIWTAVINDLPENNITPELREIIRGLFKNDS